MACTASSPAAIFALLAASLALPDLSRAQMPFTSLVFEDFVSGVQDQVVLTSVLSSGHLVGTFQLSNAPAELDHVWAYYVGGTPLDLPGDDFYGVDGYAPSAVPSADGDTYRVALPYNYFPRQGPAYYDAGPTYGTPITVDLHLWVDPSGQIINNKSTVPAGQVLGHYIASFIVNPPPAIVISMFDHRDLVIGEPVEAILYAASSSPQDRSFLITDSGGCVESLVSLVTLPAHAQTVSFPARVVRTGAGLLYAADPNFPQLQYISIGFWSTGGGIYGNEHDPQTSTSATEACSDPGGGEYAPTQQAVTIKGSCSFSPVMPPICAGMTPGTTTGLLYNGTCSISGLGGNLQCCLFSQATTTGKGWTFVGSKQEVCPLSISLFDIIEITRSRWVCTYRWGGAMGSQTYMKCETGLWTSSGCTGV